MGWMPREQSSLLQSCWQQRGWLPLPALPAACLALPAQAPALGEGSPAVTPALLEASKAGEIANHL